MAIPGNPSLHPRLDGTRPSTRPREPGFTSAHYHLAICPIAYPETGPARRQAPRSTSEIPDWTPPDSILDDNLIHIGRAYDPDWPLPDDTLLAAAMADPVGFIGGHERLIIDEVQRAPALLRAIGR